MKSILLLEMYRDAFLSIKLGRGVSGVSMAKPLYLLALLECVDKAFITTNAFCFDDVQLRKLYKQKNQAYHIADETPFIKPFYHLQSAPFYHLVWLDSSEEVKMHTPTPNFLRTHLLYAKFDDELWQLLQQAENRAYLRESVIQRFLKNT